MQREYYWLTSWIATIPVGRMAEKDDSAVRLMNPAVVNITKNWSSAKSLTGKTEVILSPGGSWSICHHMKSDSAVSLGMYNAIGFFTAVI